MAYFDCMIGGASGDGSTLTVTCYSGFAGLTISITNGVDTFSDVCPSTSPYEVVFDGLIDGTWTLSTVYNGSTYTESVEINSTTQFYPIPNGATVTPTDDIQTWLYCAGIFDKNYTSIAQVLADASTLQALIASNNAADYMARSTTWANTVCANANAMTYIGANDYCANKLLSNSTWLNAICNSSYIESVLNVKNPTMTSNATPSGQALASSSYSGSEPYLAFDGNASTRWVGATAVSAGGLVSGWLQYMFTSNICVSCVKIMDNDGYTTSELALKGSNDGNTFTTLYTYSGAAFVNNLIALVNSQKYKYYRLEVTQYYSAGRAALPSFSNVRFYGRA